MAHQWPANNHDSVNNQRQALFAVINQWVSNNLVKVNRIYQYGEGWEKWMQTDWSDFLRLTFGNNVNVQRERRAWYNGNSLDFAITANGLKYAIELKCYISGATSNAWQTQLAEDVVKINTTMQSPYNTYAKWGIGIRLNDTNITPGNDYHTENMTAQDAHGNQLNYWIDYRTFGF